jgi:hypothetical protein
MHNTRFAAAQMLQDQHEEAEAEHSQAVSAREASAYSAQHDEPGGPPAAMDAGPHFADEPSVSYGTAATSGTPVRPSTGWLAGPQTDTPSPLPAMSLPSTSALTPGDIPLSGSPSLSPETHPGLPPLNATVSPYIPRLGSQSSSTALASHHAPQPAATGPVRPPSAHAPHGATSQTGSRPSTAASGSRLPAPPGASRSAAKTASAHGQAGSAGGASDSALAPAISLAMLQQAAVASDAQTQQLAEAVRQSAEVLRVSEQVRCAAGSGNWVLQCPVRRHTARGPRIFR